MDGFRVKYICFSDLQQNKACSLWIKYIISPKE